MRPMCIPLIAAKMFLRNRKTLTDTVGQGGLHFGAGAQGTQYHDGRDSLRSQLRGYVIVDRRQAEHLNVQLLSRRTQSLEILAGVPLQSEHQRATRHCLLQSIAVSTQLAADGCSDEIGAIGVETFLHEQIDLPEIDVPEIDRDLLRIGFFAPRLNYFRLYHPVTIPRPSNQMVLYHNHEQRELPQVRCKLQASSRRGTAVYMVSRNPMNAKLILSAVVTGLVFLFVIQNVGAVEIRFLFWSFSASRSLLFLLIFFVGAVLGWSWHRISAFAWKKKRHPVE